MEKNEEILEILISEYEDIHKLKAAEKKEIRKLLSDIILDEKNNFGDYIIKLPKDISITAFVSVLGEVNKEKQIDKINSLFNHASVKKNKNLKMINKGLDLICRILKKQFSDEVKWNSINRVFSIINGYPDRKKLKFAKTFYSNLIKDSGKLLFSLKFDRNLLTKADYNNIFDILIDAIFIKSEKFDVSPGIQFDLLKWLVTDVYSKDPDDIQKNNMSFHYKKWPRKLYDTFMSDEVLKNRFKPVRSLEKELSSSVSEEDSEIKTEPLDDDMTITRDPVLELIYHLKSLKKVTSIAQNIKKEFEALNEKNAVNEKNIKELKKENSNLRKNNNESNEMLSQFKEKLKELESIKEENTEEINKLQNDKSNKEKIIDRLHSDIQIGKTNTLENFKNKISLRLKTEYNDFLSIKDKEITDSLAINLRTQLENIFNELKRNGIDL